MQYPIFESKLLKTLSAYSFAPRILISLLGFCVFYVRRVGASPQPFVPKLADKTLSNSTQTIPETMILSRFQVIGNNVIPPQEIDRVLQPYLFRPISFAELLEAQQAITQLYVARGYFTTGAYIPPQTVEDRTVKIEIIEGKISEIKIVGLKRLRPEYIRSRIAIASQPPVHQDKLLEALQLIQINPLIEKISAELSKGVQPGESYLRLEIEEANSLDLTVDFNNDTTPSIGSSRGRILVEEQNLLGWGDSFRVGYSRSEGSESLDRIEYTVPIGARGTSLRLFHNRSENEIILDPFPILDLESVSLGYGAILIQNIIDRPNQNALLAFGFTHQNTRFSLMDTGFFDLARGLNDDGRSIISTLRFIQEYSDRGNRHVFSIGSQFSLGIDAFDSIINDSESPDSQYLLWRGQARYLRAVSPKTNLSLQGTLQFSNQPLFAEEQFLAGGVRSVRGYSRDIIQGDNGLSLSAELNREVWTIPKWDLRLELGPFFDFGRIWNTDDFPLQTNTLASLGVAAKLSIAESVTADLAVGIPLIDAKLPEGDSLQDNGIHFSFSVKPF